MFDELARDVDVSSDFELHEGAGTGLDLTVEEVWREALAIVESAEPYYELHEARGIGDDLDPAEVVRQAEAIVFEFWKGEEA